MAKIDLSNFRLVKTGNTDVERNYTNDILHALYEYISSVQANGGIADAPINGLLYGRLNGAWSEVPASSGGSAITYTDTGITFVAGARAGTAIDPTLISAECSSISTGDYSYPDGGATWQLWVYPTPTSGTFELDVRMKSFANSVPDSGDSICASAKPSLSGDGLTLTATGSLSTWTDSPIARGNQVTVVPTINTADVKWWAFYMPARRTF